jgi:hypothetical protein
MRVQRFQKLFGLAVTRSAAQGGYTKLAEAPKSALASLGIELLEDLRCDSFDFENDGGIENH